MTSAELKIVEGLDEQHVDDALRVVYDAFAKKFRLGFRHADDLRRLFRDSVDRTSCLSALVDGQFAGLLTIRTNGQEFYHLNMGTLFARFSPLRALLMLLNLLLLADEMKGDEFVVETLVVDPAYRGMGIGTALLQKAEERAKSMGKRTMSLGVIGENVGAIRLYERLGYRTTQTWDGYLVRLATGSAAVHRMGKAIGDMRQDAGGELE